MFFPCTESRKRAVFEESDEIRKKVHFLKRAIFWPFSGFVGHLGRGDDHFPFWSC